MTLPDKLREYISAAFTGLWVQSHEHDDALREIDSAAARCLRAEGSLTRLACANYWSA